MSHDDHPFSIDIKKLKAQQKQQIDKVIKRLNSASDSVGFIDRRPKKRGRPSSSRTAQIHAWVLPEIAEQIAEEAQLTGKTRGAIIEEAWRVFIRRKRKSQ